MLDIHLKLYELTMKRYQELENEKQKILNKYKKERENASNNAKSEAVAV